MNRNGFTLIELMIVVAILGILLGSFPQLLTFYSRNLGLNDIKLESNRAQNVVFYCMKQFLKRSRVIKSVEVDSVTFDDDSSIKIDKTKSLIIFKNGKFKNIVKMGKYMSFSKFKRIDYYTFGSYLTLGNNVLPVFWRVGQ